MNAIFLKEYDEYTREELINKMGLEENEFNDFFYKAQVKKIIKINKKDNISFSYVGILIYKQNVLFFVPKIYPTEQICNKNLYLEFLSNIINLFKNYSKRESLLNEELQTLNFEQDSESNILSTISYIIDDFNEYGVYKNELDILELNGCGDTEWDETMDTFIPYIDRNQVIYMDYLSSENICDENYIVTKIHKAVVNKCISFCKEYNLDKLLRYEGICEIDSDYDIDYDEEMFINLIDQELAIQYEDRKVRVLHAIKSFLTQNNGSQQDRLEAFGSTNFENIWENICSDILGNEFVGNGRYKKFKLKEPVWTKDKSAEINISKKRKGRKNILNPDTLKVVKNNGETILLILDAKYYDLNFISKNEVINNPGMGDISKQYMYELALKEYCNQNTITKCINAFMIPSFKNTYSLGNVKLDFLNGIENLTCINLIKLDINEVINIYCNEEKYNISKFIELCTSKEEEKDND